MYRNQNRGRTGWWLTDLFSKCCIVISLRTTLMGDPIGRPEIELLVLSIVVDKRSCIKPDLSFSFSVFRKASNSGKFLEYDSYHTTYQKRNVACFKKQRKENLFRYDYMPAKKIAQSTMN